MLPTPGLESAASEGFEFIAVLNESLGGLGGHFENEVELAVGFEGREVGVPSVLDAGLAGLAVWRATRYRVAAPKVGIGADQVV